jgi:hypothetical protein
LSAAALLSACGGGGGSTASTSPTATVTEGFAAKGIIQKAKVLVCRISGGSVEVDTKCATGTTGDDGSYSVSLTDGWTGLVVVKIMPVTGVSKMLDETKGTYVDFSVTDGLRAVVAAAGTTTHVTPFSEIAASAAIDKAAAGTIDTTAVNAANAMVQSNFGIDLSTKPVVDLKNSSTDSDAMGKQIAMVQKLAQVVSASTSTDATKVFLKDPTTNVNCSTVACGINAMKAMAPSTTSVKQSAGTTMASVFGATVNVNVPIRKADGSMTVQKIDPNSSSDIQSKLTTAGLTTASELSSSIKASLDKDVSSASTSLAELKAKTPDASGNVAYTPPTTTQMTEMGAAKTMANFMREAFNRFSNSSKTGYLDTQSKRVDTEIQKVFRPDVDRVNHRLGSVQLGMQLYDEANGADASKLSTFTSNSITYYSKTSGTAGALVTNSGDYTVCTIQKLSTGQASADVKCLSGKSGSGYSPRSTTFNGISTNSANNVYIVGTTGVQGIMLKPLTDGSFKIGMIRQVVALTATSPNVNKPENYTIPFQSTYVRSGPYDFNVTTGLNTYNSTCLTSLAAGYDTTKTVWNETTGSTCTNFVGTGTVTRTKVAGSSDWSSLNVTADMPPSNPSNTLFVGYDKVSVAMSSTAVGTTDMKYSVSGSVAAYESPKSGSVEVDATQVVKYELSSGSYVQVTQTKDEKGNVTAENANAMNLVFTFTGYNSSATGTLTASEFVRDKNQKNQEPTKMVFDGAITDTSTGGAGDVLKGKITFQRPKYKDIDSTKDIAFGNDDGATVNIEGGVYGNKSADYVKTSLAFSKVFSAANKIAVNNVSIRLEIVGGFVLSGTGESNKDDENKPGTFKLQNQDGIRVWALPGKDTMVYAADEKTELGVYKSLPGNSGSQAFYFKDGTIISLN